MLVAMNWKESVFKVQMVSQSTVFTWFNWFDSWKAKAAGYNATETGFNDLQKPEFMKHDNHEVAIKIVFDRDSQWNSWCTNGLHDSAN